MGRTYSTNGKQEKCVQSCGKKRDRARSLGRTKRGYHQNDFTGLDQKGVNEINLHQHRYKNLSLHTNSCVSGKGLVANSCENFYKSWAHYDYWTTVKFIKAILIHGVCRTNMLFAKNFNDVFKILIDSCNVSCKLYIARNYFKICGSS